MQLEILTNSDTFAPVKVQRFIKINIFEGWIFFSNASKYTIYNKSLL